MDTRLLRTFVTLARTGSFTAAAAELHLAQSTVTVQIRALEKELGSRLFDRLPRGALITDAGRRVLEAAEEVLNAEAGLRSAVAADGPPAGHVVIGAGETLCSARLPGVVAALSRTHPQVEIALEPAGTEAAVDGLRAGRLDIALLLEKDADAGFPDIVTEPIAREPLVLVCAAEHPAAHRTRAATWADLAQETFFLHEQGCSYSDRLMRDLLSVPGARTRMTRFGSIEAARSCVAAGLGLTLLPRATVAAALREGVLAVVDGPRFPDVPVQLARHRRRWVSPAARAVVDELVRSFAARAVPGGP
ncbi:LysR family transcriptional regulator [Streptomyces sp. NPDC048479]|uniref:LysR family transcriptional regulator n=1 Tax=Streptomyces sp. NPDC048479 TaxID=3154725 RepID=UPI00343F77BB